MAIEDTQETQEIPQPADGGGGSIAILILALTLVCIVAGLALVMVSEATKESIAKQKRMLVMRGIRSVLPPGDNHPDENVTVLDFWGEAVRKKPTIFYRSIKDGEFNAVAFEVTTPEGYAGDITVMLGITKDGVLNGIEITDHAETPGLGAKATEEKFQSQFDGMGRTLKNSVWAVTKDGGEFDAIAGATITPRAILRAVAAGLEFFEVKQDIIFGARNCPEEYAEQFPQCKPSEPPDGSTPDKELAK